jgi:hypothetical protein
MFANAPTDPAAQRYAGRAQPSTFFDVVFQEQPMPTMAHPRTADLPSVTAGRGAEMPWTVPGMPDVEPDARFAELVDGYRRSGGLARAADVLASLHRSGAADIATLARWIARHEVVHLVWQTETWLPVFQFSGADMQPHAAVRRAIVELAPLMNPWELAQWFARANLELAGRRPADMLAVDPEAIWQAARADRYLLDA